MACCARAQDEVGAYNAFTEGLMNELSIKFPSLSGRDRLRLVERAWQGGQRWWPKAARALQVRASPLSRLGFESNFSSLGSWMRIEMSRDLRI